MEIMLNAALGFFLEGICDKGEYHIVSRRFASQMISVV
jgi:hypothetical protein